MSGSAMRSAGSGRQVPASAGEPAVRVQVDLELGVVVLVGVRRGLEHRGGVDAAEPADELRDPARSPSARNVNRPPSDDEVVVGGDERVDLGGRERRVADAHLAREDEVGDVEAGRGAADAVAAASRCAGARGGRGAAPRCPRP